MCVYAEKSVGMHRIACCSDDKPGAFEVTRALPGGLAPPGVEKDGNTQSGCTVWQVHTQVDCPDYSPGKVTSYKMYLPTS